jgi:hypothetical protein
MGGEHEICFHTDSCQQYHSTENTRVKTSSVTELQKIQYHRLCKIIIQYYKTVKCYSPDLFENVYVIINTSEYYLQFFDKYNNIYYYNINIPKDMTKINMRWHYLIRLNKFYSDIAVLLIMIFPGLFCIYFDRCYNSIVDAYYFITDSPDSPDSNYALYIRNAKILDWIIPGFNYFRIYDFDKKGFDTRQESKGKLISGNFRKKILYKCHMIPFNICKVLNNKLLPKHILFIFTYLVDKLNIDVVNIIGSLMYVMYAFDE